MIGTIKQCLRKTLGKDFLDTTGLVTFLCDIEAAVNSRPIIHEYGIADDPDEALATSHFLIGKRLTTIPTGPSSSDSDLTRIWRSCQHLMDSFRKRWQRVYLMDLRTFHHVKNPPKRTEIWVGDVVLWQEDVRTRHTWRKARVESVILGRDSKARTSILRVNGQTISWPVQLVITLEVDQGEEDVSRRNEIK
ncbi:uncharacterized protein [Parasteatoda tepidariorum]|uniref:uncharacterized protein n=1 Tax=Parasteatoda tepidariorum TaxID=114398 RepID=UPI0039BD64C4